MPKKFLFGISIFFSLEFSQLFFREERKEHKNSGGEGGRSNDKTFLSKRSNTVSSHGSEGSDSRLVTNLQAASEQLRVKRLFSPSPPTATIPSQEEDFPGDTTVVNWTTSQTLGEWEDVDKCFHFFRIGRRAVKESRQFIVAEFFFTSHVATALVLLARPSCRHALRPPRSYRTEETRLIFPPPLLFGNRARTVFPLFSKDAGNAASFENVKLCMWYPHRVGRKGINCSVSKKFSRT